MICGRRAAAGRDTRVFAQSRRGVQRPKRCDGISTGHSDEDDRVEEAGRRSRLCRLYVIQFFRLGLTALAWTVLNLSPIHAAELQTIQAAEADLQKCDSVSLGMSKADAERILAVPLSSGSNLTFGQGQCMNISSDKGRIAIIYTEFSIDTNLPLREIGQLVLRELPPFPEHFDDVKENSFREDILTITSNRQKRQHLDIILNRRGSLIKISVNREDKSIISDDTPGFVAQ